MRRMAAHTGSCRKVYYKGGFHKWKRLEII
jgi:hypothetical protein